MKGLRPARQDSKFISTQDEGFWGRTIDEWIFVFKNLLTFLGNTCVHNV
jgi:hypothetical protein